MELILSLTPGWDNLNELLFGDFSRQDSVSIVSVNIKRRLQYLMLCFSMGTFMVELYWKHAPNTCRNFAELARRGYYNGTKFHRIIKDFMIQGGDPTATGTTAADQHWFLL